MVLDINYYEIKALYIGYAWSQNTHDCSPG